MTSFTDLKQALQSEPKIWLITGVAGFIGSNLLEELLKLNQTVVGLDNFATGRKENLDDVRRCVSPEQWARFEFIQGDITDFDTCSRSCKGVDFVLHQAALGSVPRSIADPIASHKANVDGFINILTAARDAKVKRFVYASSSAVYGDSAELPKVEERTGKVLSPYAATKAINELYSDVYSRVFDISAIGLRYFNVFGPRQDPNGAYAAVMPKWILAMLENKPAFIYGDGLTSRDFCYIANVIQANLLAATVTLNKAHEVFNVALNDRTTLNELFELIRTGLLDKCPWLATYKPDYRPFRAGDIAHSQADISKAVELLGYSPEYTIKQGLEVTLAWYRNKVGG
jgi:UDP-N-acetylglucosamine/UDP-N-acetylgalactosamine 4-epimerase